MIEFLDLTDKQELEDSINELKGDISEIKITEYIVNGYDESFDIIAGLGYIEKIFYPNFEYSFINTGDNVYSIEATYDGENYFFISEGLLSETTLKYTFSDYVKSLRTWSPNGVSTIEIQIEKSLAHDVETSNRKLDAMLTNSLTFDVASGVSEANVSLEKDVMYRFKNTGSNLYSIEYSYDGSTYAGYASDGLQPHRLFERNFSDTVKKLRFYSPSGTSSLQIDNLSSIDNRLNFGICDGVAFGDSLIEGVGVLNLDGNVPTNDAISVASALLHTKIYNGGIGSTTMSNVGTGGFTDIADAITSGDWNVIDSKIESVIASNPNNGFESLRIQFSKIKSLDFNAIDFVIVSYGTNDFTEDVAIDNENNKYDKSTICGSLRYGIKKLINAYPHLKFYVFAPCNRFDINDTSRLKEIANAIYDCCNEIAIPCKNMFVSSNINNDNKAYYTIDNLHRNANGYDLQGTQFAKFILSN